MAADIIKILPFSATSGGEELTNDRYLLWPNSISWDSPFMPLVWCFTSACTLLGSV